ncbi:MAG: aldo/keto reductase [Pseudomonadota bacterium]
MERRTLGKTGLHLSVLGYGCGAVGGLMVRGTAADQERSIARAIELGINYFDTAPLYGNGASERNLGRVLATLRPNIHIGTKVNLAPTERSNIGASVIASLEASLQRLGRDSVDLLQLHNTISSGSGDRMLAPELVLDQVVPAFERLRQQGKTRFCGFTAIGDNAALQRLIDARSSTPPRSATTCSTRAPAAPCRRTIRRRITASCSIGRIMPGWARSASGCWPAAP